MWPMNQWQPMIYLARAYPTNYVHTGIRMWTCTVTVEMYTSTHPRLYVYVLPEFRK